MANKKAPPNQPVEHFNFPADATKAEIDEFMARESATSPQGVLGGSQEGQAFGRPPGVPVPETPLGDQPPDVRTPQPPGISSPTTTPMDRLRDAYGRAPNVVNGASTGFGIGKFFGPAAPIAAPAGAVTGGLAGMLMSPSKNPGFDLGTALATMGANALIPGSGSTSKLARFGRGALDTGIGIAGGLAGQSLDDYFHQKQLMGEEPSVMGPFGKVSLYTGAGLLSNALKARFAPGFLGRSNLGTAADEIEKSTGVKIPLSLTQKTGKFPNLGTGPSDMADELAQNQIKATKSILEKVSGEPLENTEKVVQGTNDKLKAMLQRQYGSLKDEWVRNNSTVTTTTTQQPSIIQGFSNPVTTTTRTGVNPSDFDWDKVASDFDLTPTDIASLRYIMKQPSDAWLDQFLAGPGQNSSRGLYRANALLKVLPDEAKGDFATGLTLRALDKAGVIVPTIDGLTMNATGLQRALANGALSKALEPEQYSALKKLSDIMLQVSKPTTDTSGKVVQYLGNKTAFTIAGNIGGAAMGAEMGKGAFQKTVGGLAGGLGASKIMIDLSTMISGIMHNPKLAASLEGTAKGDAQAFSSLLRGMLGAGSDALQPDQGPSADRPTRTGRAPAFSPSPSPVGR